MTAHLVTFGRATRSPVPTSASAITTKRLTAQPWAASNRPNACTMVSKSPGCWVCAMPCTIAVNDPAAA